jgi:YHS domain-containing protein/copper chaperone CopZ
MACMAMISVSARGEVFKLMQGQGNLFVCAEENGGCCCGHVEKGRAAVNKALYAEQWEAHKLRNKVHLTFVGCLGPCPIGNNAMLQLHGRSIWFKDLNDDALIPAIFEYAAAMIAANAVLPPPEALADHVYERYVAPPAGDYAPLVPATAAATEMDFDGIDPVCMMTVDPATARWHSEFEGKTYHFCAPSCKTSFDKDPVAYLRPQAPAAVAAVPARADSGQGDPLMNKTFVVPNITCDHCVRSIKNELSEIAGVKTVDGQSDTKAVTVAWESPATWEQIKAALSEIDYPPEEQKSL